MAIIEELPDVEPSEGLKNQHLSLDAMIEQASNTYFGPKDGSVGADMPEAMAAVRNTTAEEFIKQMNKMPLFMTELDEEGEDGGENIALEAIKALQQEGEPHEVALNFKENGNERFKIKDYIDAREFYTKALAAKCDRDDINIACLNNRAACNLELKNYRKCITDCRAVLKMDPNNDKAWFRAGKALLAIDKLEEAKLCVENALALKPTHKQIRELAEAVEKRTRHVEALEKARAEREKRKKWEEGAIKIALKARGISTRTTREPPDMPEEIKIDFEEKGKPDTHLVFPVLLIYHLHLQTDLIAAWHETTAVGDQLAEVLGDPLLWDTGREYTPPSVECYIETKTGGLVKVGKKVGLLEALSNPKVEIVDGLVRLLVVPRKRNAEFIEKWKVTMKK